MHDHVVSYDRIRIIPVSLLYYVVPVYFVPVVR